MCTLNILHWCRIYSCFIGLSIDSNREINTWLIKFKDYWASEKPLQK